MNVVVLGCGRVGSGLARALDERGATVAVVDRDRESFRRLPERFTGRAVLGNVIDPEVLEQAGIADATAVAAVTSGDNSNIVAARIARETYEVESVVARIKDPGRAEIYQRLGIPTVATVTWTVDRVLRHLAPHQLDVEWSHPLGGVQLVERALPTHWAGRSLDALLGDDGYRLAVVTRAGKPKLASRGLIGQEGDILHLVVDATATEQLEAALQQGERG